MTQATQADIDWLVAFLESARDRADRSHAGSVRLTRQEVRRALRIVKEMEEGQQR